MTDRIITLTEAQADLLYESVRFLVWAVGQGISPTDDSAGEPDDILMVYTGASDDADWEGLPERIKTVLSRDISGDVA